MAAEKVVQGQRVDHRRTLVFCKQSLLCYTEAWKRDVVNTMPCVSWRRVEDAEGETFDAECAREAGWAEDAEMAGGE